MADVFRTMIVTAELAPLARALASGLSPRGAGMFTAALSATGASPATHYASSGLIDEQIATLLGDADLLFAACQQAGANVTLPQCQALVDTSDVTEDSAFVALDRLSLKLVNEGVAEE